MSDAELSNLIRDVNNIQAFIDRSPTGWPETAHGAAAMARGAANANPVLGIAKVATSFTQAVRNVVTAHTEVEITSENLLQVQGEAAWELQRRGLRDSVPSDTEPARNRDGDPSNDNTNTIPAVTWDLDDAGGQGSPASTITANNGGGDEDSQAPAPPQTPTINSNGGGSQATTTTTNNTNGSGNGNGDGDGIDWTPPDTTGGDMPHPEVLPCAEHQYGHFQIRQS
ncbi:MAG: hypothetical protein MK098_14825 [Marinovum sp.]|nr:hypothetical protein [Marinovum sp.]